MEKNNYLKKFFSFASAIIFLAVFALLLIKNENPENFIFEKKQIIPINGIQYVKIAGQTLKVSLALTPEERERGLSGRTGLKEDEGMLFVFENPARRSFWMKDMNFAIDIIWLAPSKAGIEEDLQVLYIKKDARPDSFPETFGPNKDAQYVLEVISGFSEKNNLKAGDPAEFLP